MPIYFVTNKRTFARAVVVAPDELTARSMRPDHAFDCNVWWRGGRWMTLGSLAVADRAAPALECWPDDLEMVHADELGSAGRLVSGTTQVLAFTRDCTPRAPGEGPDDSWGARPADPCGALFDE